MNIVVSPSNSDATMYKLVISFSVIAIMCGSPSAVAQNCPIGIPSAGNPLCLPPDHEGSPYYQRRRHQELPPRRAYWRSTWGSIAASIDGSWAVGFSMGKWDKVVAEVEAMEQCRSMGGARCVPVLSYKDRCAVIAWPSSMNSLVKGTPIAKEGASIERASNDALGSCLEKNSDKECRIVYSECTRPVLME